MRVWRRGHHFDAVSVRKSGVGWRIGVWRRGHHFDAVSVKKRGWGGGLGFGEVCCHGAVQGSGGKQLGGMTQP